MSTIKIYDNQNTENKTLPQIFNFEAIQVRIILDEKEEPWFFANDVASILGYNRTNHATRMLDDNEKGAHIVSTNGGPQKIAIVNESGLYSLIFASRKSEARKFKKWVTSDVLPTIRKTGRYGRQIDLGDPKQLHKLILDYTNRTYQLENHIEANQPKVSFYDHFINSEGLYNLQNAARALGYKPNLFISSLKNHYLFYQGNALVPYRRYMDQGLFVVKSNAVDNKVYYQTYVTPKGLEYFAKQQNYLKAS